MRFQFNSSKFMQQVSEGDITGLSCDQLEIFEKILPRNTEVQKLKEILLAEGFDTFEEAQRVVKFGISEDFIIMCEANPNL